MKSEHSRSVIFEALVCISLEFEQWVDSSQTINWIGKKTLRTFSRQSIIVILFFLVFVLFRFASALMFDWGARMRGGAGFSWVGKIYELKWRCCFLRTRWRTLERLYGQQHMLLCPGTYVTSYFSQTFASLVNTNELKWSYSCLSHHCE